MSNTATVQLHLPGEMVSALPNLWKETLDTPDKYTALTEEKVRKVIQSLALLKPSDIDTPVDYPSGSQTTDFLEDYVMLVERALYINHLTYKDHHPTLQNNEFVGQDRHSDLGLLIKEVASKYPSGHPLATLGHPVKTPIDTKLAILLASLKNLDIYTLEMYVGAPSLFVPPTITLAGGSVVVMDRTEVYSEPGWVVSGSQAVPGIDNVVLIDTSLFDPVAPGTYTLTYYIESDPSYYTTRQVVVTGTYTPPEITLIGDSVETYHINNNLPTVILRGKLDEYYFDNFSPTIKFIGKSGEYYFDNFSPTIKLIGKTEEFHFDNYAPTIKFIGEPEEYHFII